MKNGFGLAAKIVAIALTFGAAPVLARPSASDIRPDNYQSIVLEERNSNFVKSKGRVRVLFSQSAAVGASIKNAYGTDRQFGDSFKRMYTTPANPSDTRMYGKYGDHALSFEAPELPGTYEIVFSEADLRFQRITDVASKYEIVVLDKVESEKLAVDIAARDLFGSISEVNIKDWKIVSQKVESVGDSWIVFLQASYQSCGIDWSDNICSAKTAKGHYQINKSSGIVTSD